jgi:hypothetical protein
MKQASFKSRDGRKHGNRRFNALCPAGESPMSAKQAQNQPHRWSLGRTALSHALLSAAAIFFLLMALMPDARATVIEYQFVSGPGAPSSSYASSNLGTGGSGVADFSGTFSVVLGDGALDAENIQVTVSGTASDINVNPQIITGNYSVNCSFDGFLCIQQASGDARVYVSFAPPGDLGLGFGDGVSYAALSFVSFECFPGGFACGEGAGTYTGGVEQITTGQADAPEPISIAVFGSALGFLALGRRLTHRPRPRKSDRLGAT